MLKPHDKQKTMTVEQLRIRYNLDALEKDRKAIQLVKNTINKTETELQKFIGIINNSLKEYPNQVDNNITAWFFNGIPTEEQPMFKEQEIHLGDLYYDRESGISYKYKKNNETYYWEIITDTKVLEILAIASSSSDTADNKRISFITTPQPPYNIGDVWINNGIYYRCRASRTEGIYNPLDWIKSSEYTDDLVILQTKAELDQFKTYAEENYTSNATFETSINSIAGKVEETYTKVEKVAIDLNDNYYTQDQVNAFNELNKENITVIKNTVENNQTATQQQINVIQENINNGISKITTTSGTFDENGLNIAKTGEEMNTIVDWDGLAVKRDDTEVLTVRSSGVETENMKVRKYFILEPMRIEKTRAISDNTKIGIGFFYTGGAS